MSETAQECRDRAAALRATHGTSPLTNVRDRYEAAALKWEAMAETAERIVKQRAARCG
ncbi:hypothetical protein HRV97_14230 [Sphingomonas sp. HHU CXW]|uniref:Uncharacterized protein n=1 Tax=Sphingomonas hominis TaxID=2741495 RepID=A0ABX2JLF0_9SPHN|nr:hypothetical protein [Sphingomonas hominis]NTS66315.1 hypothetical protein [Sphingomonas hominis]